MHNKKEVLSVTILILVLLLLVSLSLQSLVNYEIGNIFLKTNDKKYLIYAIHGAISFKDNINECYQKINL